MTGLRIGIDLGGTKIELVALDDAGTVRWRERIATPQGDYPATLAALCALVARAEQALGSRATVGVGTPGSPSPRERRRTTTITAATSATARRRYRITFGFR